MILSIAIPSPLPRKKNYPLTFVSISLFIFFRRLLLGRFQEGAAPVLRRSSTVRTSRQGRECCCCAACKRETTQPMSLLGIGPGLQTHIEKKGDDICPV